MEAFDAKQRSESRDAQMAIPALLKRSFAATGSTSQAHSTVQR